MRNTCYNYSRYLYIILLMYKISERKHFFTFVKWKFKKHKIITLASFQRSFFSHFLTPLSYIYFPFPLLYFFKGSPVTISIISLPFLTCFFLPLIFILNIFFLHFDVVRQFQPQKSSSFVNIFENIFESIIFSKCYSKIKLFSDLITAR